MVYGRLRRIVSEGRKILKELTGFYSYGNSKNHRERQIAG
jgi:hypothetical protein